MVIDSSVAMAWFLQESIGASFQKLIAEIENNGAVAPSHWRLECANALWVATKTKRISKQERSAIIADLDKLQIAIDIETSERAWRETLDLSDTHDLTTYDASYLELAIRLGDDLATLDKSLRQAAKREGVKVLPA
jgi:predicted nucleic acid-binding protein